MTCFQSGSAPYPTCSQEDQSSSHRNSSSSPRTALLLPSSLRLSFPLARVRRLYFHTARPGPPHLSLDLPVLPSSNARPTSLSVFPPAGGPSSLSLNLFVLSLDQRTLYVPPQPVLPASSPSRRVLASDPQQAFQSTSQHPPPSFEHHHRHSTLVYSSRATADESSSENGEGSEDASTSRPDSIDLGPSPTSVGLAQDIEAERRERRKATNRSS